MRSTATVLSYSGNSTIFLTLKVELSTVLSSQVLVVVASLPKRTNYNNLRSELSHQTCIPKILEWLPMMMSLRMMILTKVSKKKFQKKTQTSIKKFSFLFEYFLLKRSISINTSSLASLSLKNEAAGSYVRKRQKRELM